MIGIVSPSGDWRMPSLMAYIDEPSEDAVATPQKNARIAFRTSAQPRAQKEGESFELRGEAQLPYLGWRCRHFVDPSHSNPLFVTRLARNPPTQRDHPRPDLDSIACNFARSPCVTIGPPLTVTLHTRIPPARLRCRGTCGAKAAPKTAPYPIIPSPHLDPDLNLTLTLNRRPSTGRPHISAAEQRRSHPRFEGGRATRQQSKLQRAQLGASHREPALRHQQPLPVHRRRRADNTRSHYYSIRSYCSPPTDQIDIFPPAVNECHTHPCWRSSEAGPSVKLVLLILFAPQTASCGIP
jgi:hypothetical protein